MSFRVPIEDEASVSVVRQQTRALGRDRGVPVDLVERAALIASELGHNHLRHARLGEIEVRTVARGPALGLEVHASDTGAGLRDPLQAFRGALRMEGAGLGVGLAGVRRLATELDVDGRRGEGLRLTARIWPDDVARAPQIAMFGRPHPDERTSGDDAAWVRTDDRIVLIVADGLGHGPEARAASSIACRCCVAHAALEPGDALLACDGALKGTRGSAVGFAALDLRTDAVTVAIAGNVRAGLFGPTASQRFPYTPRVLGRSESRRIRTTTFPREGRSLVLFTDGLPEKTDPSEDRALLVGWPMPLAWTLLDGSATARDDAMVAVLR
jgi:anti-sigma regulatory factor (Ser/Thr protein kinase)